MIGIFADKTKKQLLKGFLHKFSKSSCYDMFTKEDKEVGHGRKNSKNSAFSVRDDLC